MTNNEIDEKIEKIIDYFNAADIQSQSTALDAYYNLLSKETLTNDQKKQVLPFIKKVLDDPDSPLRTNVFQIATLTGIKNFNLIEDIFPIIFKELQYKNRFRSDIVINLLLNLRNSNYPLIQDAIKQLIKKTPLWFDKSYLLPIIEKFWHESTSQSFQFMNNYINEIKEELAKYPETFQQLKNFILHKIDDHNEYLNEIAKQKEIENRLREDEKRKREELKRKEEELRLKQEEERIKMKKKLEEYVKTISDQPVKQPLDSKQNNTQLPPTIEGIPKSEPKNIEIEDSSAFTTFTNLGLKRKKLDEEED